MDVDRRTLLRAAMAGGAVASVPRLADARADAPRRPSIEELARVAEMPVLRTDLVPRPVEIASMELLRNGREFLVRVRSKDGAEGIGVTSSGQMKDSYPIFLNRVAPFFVGKDARALESLLWGVYRHDSNYKLQGLPYWVCIAGAEIAVLDLLGKLAGEPIGALLGGVVRTEIPVYVASGNRGNAPEEEIEHLKRIVAESGARALKFRLGGRMSKDADSRPGRDEAIIPMVREAFGPEMTLYADANSSYVAGRAIEIGRLMEANGFGYFEEPCEFDDYESTRLVAEALDLPVAGGEQESSEHRFRWMIAQGVLDIVQPDLHYYGGMIRSMRVARMAEAAGMSCTPHMSGWGLGYLDLAHFVSALRNPAPFHEFKGNTAIPVRSDTAPLRCEGGVVRVPTGPGYGITIDPAYLRESEVVSAS